MSYVGGGKRKKKIREAAVKRGEGKAVGWSLKPSGYIEITRGVNKGKRQHRAFMEEHLGRKLLPDEVVHHIDGNKANNDISNLMVMNNKEHNRLHMLERLAKGKQK